jgi:hypothetical protein
MVLGLYGVKKLRRRRKPIGLKKEIRVIRPFRDLKLLFVGKSSNLVGPRI